MNRLIILIVFVCSGALRLSASVDTIRDSRWLFFGGLSVPFSFYDYTPAVWNYQHKIGEFEAFPAEELIEEGLVRSNPVAKSINISFLTGLEYTWDNQILQLSMGFSTFRMNGRVSRVRFTDMIDESRGFVMASAYSNGIILYDYNMVTGGFRYYIGSNFNSPGACYQVGVGLNWAQVMNSSYSIESTVLDQTTMVESTVYFKTYKDLTITDNIHSLYPCLSARVSVLKGTLKGLSLTFDGSYGLRLVPLKKGTGDTSNFLISQINIGLQYSWDVRNRRGKDR